MRCMEIFMGCMGGMLYALYGDKIFMGGMRMGSMRCFFSISLIFTMERGSIPRVTSRIIRSSSSAVKHVVFSS